VTKSETVMSETKIIVEYCHMLGSIRRMFRRAHIAIERSGRFKDVTCTVSHAEGQHAVVFGEKQRIDTVEVSYSLDCELFQETADGRYSLGASFALRHMGERWRCEGEIGWSCRDSGWEDFESLEITVDSVLESRSEIEAFVERILKSQAGLIERQFADPGV